MASVMIAVCGKSEGVLGVGDGTDVLEVSRFSRVFFFTAAMGPAFSLVTTVLLVLRV